MKPLLLLLTILLIALLPIITLARDNGEGELYKSVDEQMRETLEMAEKYPNASPKELAALLGSSHGRGFQKNEKINLDNKGSASEGVATTTTTTTTTTPTPTPTPTPVPKPQPTTTTTTTPSKPITDPNGQKLGQTKSGKTESTSTAPQKTITTPTTPTPTQDTTPTPSPQPTPTTITTPQENPAHSAAFFFILVFLLVAFIIACYFAYTHFTEPNPSGLYQPLNQQHTEDGNDSDIDLDDVELGGVIPIDHGSLYGDDDHHNNLNNKTNDLLALDSIKSNTHTLNNNLIQKGRERGNDGSGLGESGFGYKEVLAQTAPNHTQTAIVLQNKPPQSIQSDQVIDLNDGNGGGGLIAVAAGPQSGIDHTSIDLTTITPTTSTINNTSTNNNNDDDEFESWESASGGEIGSPRLSGIGSGDGGLLSLDHKFVPTAPVSKPTINSDTISLSAMLGASYAGADSRIKIGGGGKPTTTSTTTSQSQSSTTTPSRPTVIMKDPSTRNEVQKPRTLGAVAPSSPSSSLQPQQQSSSPLSPSRQSQQPTSQTKFTSFTPIGIDTSNLATVQSGPVVHKSFTHHDDEDAIFGGAGMTTMTNPTNATTTTPSPSKFSTTQQQPSPQSQQPTQSQQQQQPTQSQQQPSSTTTTTTTIDDEFGFDLGLGGDDDDWFQDVPDTSAAMDLIQKSNSILADLDL